MDFYLGVNQLYYILYKVHSHLVDFISELACGPQTSVVGKISANSKRQ